ncbi:hypothetical protein RYX36_022771 [Vicia faba]
MTHNGAHAVASYEGATLHFRSDPDDSVAIAPLTVPTFCEFSKLTMDYIFWLGSTILKWFPSFVWLFLGFYWVTAGGQSLTRVSPQLYWLCITFLAFDVAIVVICVTAACLIGIAVCCFLPCILAILYAVTDQEGATKEEIDLLPKYKFRIIKELKKEGDAQESSRGVMTECDSGSASEHIIALEDAECCICLSAYDDEAELRELPCNHHFHCTCIDKWLLINATRPLCKFNILSTDNLQEV